MMLSYCLAIAIHLNGVSHHIGAERNYNERNWGAGVSCEYERGRRWSADVFEDSNNELSGYVAHEWDMVSGEHWRLGVAAGAMHRKDVQRISGAAVFPFGVPYIGTDVGPVEARVTGFPRLREDDPSLIAAQVRVQW